MRTYKMMAWVAGWALASALLIPTFSPAQDAPATNQAEEKKDDLPQISKVTEGMEKREGFIHLWVDEKKDRLYAEIPGGRMNKDFLVATSISSGQLAGLQTVSTIWRFERQDTEALIVVPNTFYTASGELKTIVETSYPDQVIATARILGQGSGGAILIDMKSLLAAQAREYARMTTPAKITQVAKAKSFPANTVVELQFRGPTGGSGVYFNLGDLPPSGFKSRRADPRVGYFVTAKRDFSKDPREETTFERHINRWRIEKQDASLSMSPPKEPIVIYIDKNVPIKYRRWVREGIESWNTAFEKVGFVGAIEVRQQTETNQFKDFDPEDARYNFFRWIASQTPFAIAPSRVDPRTGEVLDSDILFDESMVRYYLQEYDLFANSMPEAMDLSPRMRHWLARHPHEHPNWRELSLQISMRIQRDPALAGLTPEQVFAREMTRDLTPAFQGYCSIGFELSRELAFAGLGLEYASLAQEQDAAEEGEEKKQEEGEEAKEDEKPKKRDLMSEWPEEFIGPIIREIVAHEFGHTLGLRHNFKASTWKSYDEIAGATDPKAPTVGSVMDYNPFTLKADGTLPEVWITPAIGPYDVWAIEYGYAVPGSAGYPGDEKKMLEEILAKVADDGHDYGTDEDVWSPDPTITRWDLGKDSLAYYRARVDLADKILDNLLEVAVGEGESYAKARRAYEILLVQRYAAAANATKFVGGFYLHRDHKGDPNARQPIEVVAASRQREAMKLIHDTLLGPDALKIDPTLQNYLAASRWYHRDSDDMYAPLTYPIQDTILSYQRGVLFRLTNPESIQYLYDSEMHVPADQEIYTLPEMMDSLTKAVWAEVLDDKSLDRRSTVREPMIDNLRRNLQREYIGQLIKIATQGETSFYPAVARTLAWKQLKDLGERIDKVLADRRASQLDPYSAAHLEESSKRIQKALEADFTIGGGSGGGLFLIFGQGTPEDATDATRTPGGFDPRLPF